MRSRHGVWLSALVLLCAGCGQHDSAPTPEAAPATSATSPTATVGAASAGRSATEKVDKQAVAAVVKRFGARMQKVSVLAPPDAVRSEMESAYAGLLTRALLQTWREHPSRVVGREGSSPWPAGIDITRTDCSTRDRCRVQGQVRYVTSNEVEHGGVAQRRPVRLNLQRVSGHNWRIAEVDLDSK